MKLFLIALAFLALAATANAQTTKPATFTLTWQDNSGNEDGFRIERRLGQTGAFAVAGTVGANIVTFVDTIPNDTGNQEYCYRVQAFIAALNSSFTNAVCATSPVIVPFPPIPPTGLSVSVKVTVP